MGGWDTHTDNFGAMKNLLPVLDKGFAPCWRTWPQRGLLAARSSSGTASSAARRRSTGTRPGTAGGTTTRWSTRAWSPAAGSRAARWSAPATTKGEKVQGPAGLSWDLAASIYKLLGIDPTDRLPHPQGCVAYVTPLASGAVPSGGLLTEIM